MYVYVYIYIHIFKLNVVVQIYEDRYMFMSMCHIYQARSSTTWGVNGLSWMGRKEEFGGMDGGST